MPEVEITGVSKAFPRQGKDGMLSVLNDVNLSLAERNVHLLVGPSGCGKSTLLRIIDGLMARTRARYASAGERVKAPSLDRGFVFQQFNLLPWRTVLGNVEFGLENLGMQKEERRRGLHEIIKHVDLEGSRATTRRSSPAGCSSASAWPARWRVEPSILLMDEPFGSVDDQTRMLLQEELLKIWERRQKTVIFVTHDIEEALFLGDRVVVMGPRPSGSSIVEVPFGRPRYDGVRGTRSMARLKQEIWDELKVGATVEG